MRLLDLISPRELSQVASLQLLAREVVEGFCSGRHRSPHKGFSVEFKEHRQYVRGDELKKIDWKVYGKSDKLFIREYEEETNLRCTVLVDRSGSMAYGGTRAIGGITDSDKKTRGHLSKTEYAIRLAASLSYLLLSQQDAVGMLTFDDAIRDQVPQRSRPSHLSVILETLCKPQTHRETDLGGVFHRVAAKLHRRGFLVILSDGMGDVDSIGRALAQFRSQRHEIVFMQVLDPDEIDFPFEGRIQFRDLEDQDHSETVDAKSFRDGYRNRFEQHQAALKEVCRRHRVDHVLMSTDRPIADGLGAYLAWRRQVG